MIKIEVTGNACELEINGSTLDVAENFGVAVSAAFNGMYEEHPREAEFFKELIVASIGNPNDTLWAVGASVEVEKSGSSQNNESEEMKVKKKVMVVLPTGGRTEAQVGEHRAKVEKNLTEAGYEVMAAISPSHPYHAIHGQDGVPAWRVYIGNTVGYLSELVKYMQEADVVFFGDGWMKSRTCRLDHDIVTSYGLKTMYEESEEVATKKMVMISQPMKGLTEEQIRANRANVVEELIQAGYEVMSTVHTYYPKPLSEKQKGAPIWYLSKSVEFMSGVDAVFFMDGWSEARGCKIEHEIAKAYGLEIIYEVE